MTPLRARLVGLVGLLAAVSITSCTSGARREAEALAQGVERFRRAENTEKPGLLAGIANTSCSENDVCEARDVCLASAEATSKALREKSEVEAALRAIENGKLARDSEAAQALPAKLDRADALLKEGFQRLPACDDRIQALKRTYRF